MRAVALLSTVVALTALPGCLAVSNGSIESAHWIPAPESAEDYVVIARGLTGDACASKFLGVAFHFPHVHEAIEEIHEKAAPLTGAAEYAMVNVVRDSSRRYILLVYSRRCEIVTADIAVPRSELAKLPPPPAPPTPPPR